jgi:arsenate reductase
MEIYHNPRCTKSRETLKIITDAGADVEIIEYLKSVPTEAELSALINKLGIPVVALLRKGEAIFKEEFKGKTLTDSEWISAMVKYPKLIERPIVVKGNKALLGRPPENVKIFL